jgi:hypothetical protein
MAICCRPRIVKGRVLELEVVANVRTDTEDLKSLKRRAILSNQLNYDAKKKSLLLKTGNPEIAQPPEQQRHQHAASAATKL